MKLKFSPSCFLLFQSFFILGLCDDFVSEYYGLFFYEKNGNFGLKKPYKAKLQHNREVIPKCQFSTSSSFCTITTFNSYYKPSEGEKTYIACPLSRWENDSLLQVLPINLNDNIEDSFFCSHSIRIATAEVKDFCTLTENCSKDIKLFHFGFKILTTYLTRGRERVRPNYQSWDSRYDLILGIAMYTNNSTKKVMTATYQLLSTPVDSWNERDFIENHKKMNDDSVAESSGIQNSSDKDLINDMNAQKANLNISILDFDDQIYRTNDHLKMKVIASFLAPNEHFQIPLWKQTALHLTNRIYIPFDVFNKWKSVALFSRIVAKHLGDLKVSTGITGTMTVNTEDGKRKMTITVNNEIIILPRYYWYTFEFIEDQKSYGILVILNGNPVENDKKICDDDVGTINGWLMINADFKSGKIYCCPMTKENITKLEADYLQLNEREIFNLGNWGNKVLSIIKEFNNPLVDHFEAQSFGFFNH